MPYRLIRWLAVAAGLLSFVPCAVAALKSDFELGGQWKLNSASRLMAGLSPMHPGHFDLAQSAAWKEHSAAMQAGWAQVRAKRVAAMESWRNDEVSKSCPVGRTLLYPFSGPDFFNAYWLFPECETYVMFGLEHIGEIPDLDAMSERDLARLMADVRAATSDLFQRNYFITENMTRQLYTAQLRGVVPLFMISMAMSGVEILRLAPHELGPVVAGGNADADDAATAPTVKRSLRKPKGIAIEFRAPGSPTVRRLIYYTVDASNSSMAKYPGFLAFLKKFGPTTTLVKSASYLLHTREFTRLRATLLNVSQFLVQDDSGLPYKMLVSRGWRFQLHGTYAVPIPPFEGAFQPALQAAYRKQQPEPLPFEFGYHYQDRRDQRSNVMVGRKAETRSLARLSRSAPRMLMKTANVRLR